MTECKISRTFLHNFKLAIFWPRIGLFENFKSLYSLESFFWHDCVIFFMISNFEGLILTSKVTHTYAQKVAWPGIAICGQMVAQIKSMKKTDPNYFLILGGGVVFWHFLIWATWKPKHAFCRGAIFLVYFCVTL